jgi:uncharacterized protein
MSAPYNDLKWLCDEVLRAFRKSRNIETVLLGVDTAGTDDRNWVFDCVFWSLISAKDWELAEMCLNHGYRLESMESYEYGSLYRSIERYGDNAQIIHWLLDHGADIERRVTNNWTSLHLAVKSRCIHVAECLLERGAMVDSREVIDENHTPLMIAAAIGDLRFVELLLRYGANPSLTDTAGRDSAAIARKRGHHEVVARLEAAGGVDQSPGPEKGTF